MCKFCSDSLSRRELLKLTALSFPAFLAACSDQAPVRDQLPDAIGEYSFADLPPDSPPLHIDPRTIAIPPETPAQHTDFGAIFPRSAWTSATMALARGTPLARRDLIIIHHSGDGKPFRPASRADVIRHLQIVRMAHLQRGMIDIAYHFAVDPFGQAWQLRSLLYEGQHCRISKTGPHAGTHWNQASIGICALGDFNLQTLGSAQRDRLIALTRLIRGKYALAASAVRMHGELVQTDCPGKNLRLAIAQARTHAEL